MKKVLKSEAWLKFILKTLEIYKIELIKIIIEIYKVE